MITNFYVDISEPMTTKSWVVTVFTEDDFFIDWIGSGLTQTFDCYAPCQTCYHDASPALPNRCKSCNILTGKTILYDRYCWEQCPTQTYYDASAYTCKPCENNCLECEPENGNICLACNKAGTHPFLDGSNCKAKCPFGTYGNKITGECEAC